MRETGPLAIPALGLVTSLSSRKETGSLGAQGVIVVNTEQ